MSYSTADFNYGPSETPKPLLYLIASIGIISILSTLLNGFFSYFLGSAGPEEWLSLSLRGIQNFHIWQPFTYMFTHSSYAAGISISYLISLVFNLYVLWILGSAVMERIGLNSFFKLFFISGIISGLVALLLMKVTSSYSLILSGPGPSLLASLSFWTLLYSDATLSFFFIFKLKAKWLSAGIFMAILLSCLSQLDFVLLSFYLTGMISGYLYGVIAHDLKGPFPFLNAFEDFIFGLFKGKTEVNSKIVDINTGQAIDDDIFVDAMLAKISKSGENSLSFYERKRLDEISKRKKR
jgi:membrane associated rhomboid family serine protease